MIFLAIVAVIVVLLLIGTILHATCYKSKRMQIQPYGQMIGAAKLQQTACLSSVLAPLTVKRTESYAYGYTEKEIDDMVVFAGFSMNDNVLQAD